MTAPPLIAVLTHELKADDPDAWAPGPGRAARDLRPQRLSMRLSYTQALQEAGAIAAVLPAHGYTHDADTLLDRVDGLVISGGPDIDPALYGQRRHPQVGPDVDATCDGYELDMIRRAVDRDLPLLGICRGMQALNVAFAGTLHQHLPDLTDLQHTQSHEPYLPAHTARLDAGSLLAATSQTREIEVNSFHHQAADRIGDGLQVTGWAPDGTVEALERPGSLFCVGVQWHAELLTHQRHGRALMDAFIAAAQGRLRDPAPAVS